MLKLRDKKSAPERIIRVSVLFVVSLLVGPLTHATRWSIGEIHLNIIGVSIRVFRSAGAI